MYASKRSIAKAQGLNINAKKNNKIYMLRHRGMQKDHIQVTPDGKQIVHYKIDSRSAQVMKEFKRLQTKADKEQVTEEIEEKSAEVSE